MCLIHAACFQGEIGAQGFSGPPGPPVSFQTTTESLKKSIETLWHTYFLSHTQGRMGPKGIKGLLGVRGPPVSV